MRAARVSGRAGERGFAMIAVLLVLAVIGLLGTEFAYSMRLEARAARNFRDAVMAGHLAEAGLESAIREIAGQGTLVAEGDDGLLTFYTRDRIALKRLPREAVALGDGQYSYRITDEAARININNRAAPARLARLLQLLDVEKQERDTIVDSIQDWIDDNDEHRANGAESDDYYLKLPVPYRARNANLESIDELLQIKGVTPALFRGTPERPGLAEFLTVVGQIQGQGQRLLQVNVNTASKLVLSALGVSDAQIIDIEATRRERPLNDADLTRFGNSQLTTTTQTYRIEALGLLEGKPRARLTAVVEIGVAPTQGVRVLSWSGIR
jgi:general secretion pathway protein K